MVLKNSSKNIFRKDYQRITLKEGEKEPNGGEKHFGEDYNIFRRNNKPFEDLVFKRENEIKKLKRRKIDKNNDENRQISAEEKAVEEEKEEYVENEANN